MQNPPKNTSILRLYLGAVAIGYATDQSMNFSKNLPEYTNKDSGGFKQVMSGTKSGTISHSGFYIDSLSALHDWYDGTDVATIKLSDEETGEEYFQGEAHCNEFSLSTSGANEPATYSISAEFTGAFTRGTN